MVEKELHDLIESIRIRGCEGQTVEVKAARRRAVLKSCMIQSLHFPIKIAREPLCSAWRKRMALQR